MASWAYYILYSSTNPTGYGNWQWSRELHYITTRYFMNEIFQTNLHALWDVDLMMVRLERDFQQDTSCYYDYIYQLMLNQSSCNNDDDNNIEQLVKKSFNLVCTQIYFDENNEFIS
ncbi:unnamed protein product [Rotaria sordida]|uniref:Uncharacterized protein n=1 Tax=Rotaria sordida TaxID=392033 RepID=A0A815JMD7_9BILA|nr:unnamed protein product [Rotaria sordida]CAF1384305.1 unnamed protein product [Rotaria sordida]